MAHSAAPKLGPGLRGELVLQRAGYACLDQLGRNEQVARTESMTFDVLMQWLSGIAETLIENPNGVIEI